MHEVYQTRRNVTVKTSMKEKKAAKAAAKKQEDIKSYRLMIEFLLAIAALSLAIMAGNASLEIIPKVLPILLLVTGVFFGLSALYFSFMRIKRIDETDKVITSTGIFGNATALFFLTSAFYLYTDVQLLTSALIAFIVVYIVYNIEGNGFFGYSALTAATYMSLVIAGRPSLVARSYNVIGDVIILASKVLVFAVPALMIVIALLTFFKKGVTVLGIKFDRKRIATAMLITALIALIGAVFTVIYTTGVSMIIYALIAVYFMAMVIGVFKMM